MSKTIRICLSALLFVSLFWGCTDHLSRPLSPLRLRLKTFNLGYSDGSFITTNYVYDRQNRMVAYDQSIGIRGTITYDDQNKYRQIDETGPNVNTSQRRYYTYQTNAQGKLVTEKSYQVDRQTGLQTLLGTATYVFDANDRLIRSASAGADSTTGPTATVTTYTYTNDDITKTESTLGQAVNTTTYEFDDKLNPLYGLATPLLPVSVFAFNRNNFTRYRSFYNNTPMTDFTFIYEYNAQGLPVSRRVDTLRSVDTFVYESY